MLVLSRKKRQEIVVEHKGERMTLQVVEIRSGDKVRLSFDAPASFTIHRGEIQQIIDATPRQETVWGSVDIGGEG